MALPNYVLFVGNPGTGKSTLLNSILGNSVFRSGVSYGSGLTYEMQKFCKDGIVYCDTPGLADSARRQTAANEINKALTQTGFYRLFFVIVLDSGRVIPQDIATINLVTQSLTNSPNNSYGIIINKVTNGVKAKILEQGFGVIQKLLTVQPQKFYVNLNDESLIDKENAVVQPSPKLLEFIFNLPPMKILPTNVKPIATGSFEQLVRDLEQQSAQIGWDLKELSEETSKILEALKNLTPEKIAQIKHNQ